MGEFVDRGHQRQLLRELNEVFPKTKGFSSNGDEAGRRTLVNLWYLRGHCLIEGEIRLSTSGDNGGVAVVRLTSQGWDFLADDGGLGAILGVVTVKLHDDTIRDLLLARVDADPIATEDQKKGLRATIRGLPVEALKEMVKEATKLGLSHVDDLRPWIEHAVQYIGRHLG